MANPNPQHTQDKNVVSQSNVSAGNNVHIGDIINNHPPDVIHAPRYQHSFSRSIKMLVLAVISVFTFILYLIIDSGREELTDSKPTTTSNNYENENFEPSTASPSKQSLPIKEVSLKSKDEKTDPLDGVESTKAANINALIKGVVLKINGDGIIKPFFINKYEVTVEQYYLFCKTTGHPFPHGKVDTLNRNHPMNYVSWYDAIDYCKYIGGRLPTVEEWIQVALVVTGTDSLMEKSEKLAVSWNKENSQDVVHPVGMKRPANNIELYDIFGNVEEWCADGPSDNVKYTLGGFYNSYLLAIDLKYKSKTRATTESEVVGFRVIY